MKGLSADTETARRIRFRGIVTAANADFRSAIIQDGSTGIRARTAGSIAERLLFHREEVTGSTRAGVGSDEVVDATLQGTGPVVPPPPVLLSRDAPPSNTLDEVVVTATGILGTGHLEAIGQGFLNSGLGKA